jgi:hypothetical protein
VRIVAETLKQPLGIVSVNIGEWIENGWKEWDYIIPARNFFFGCIAADILSRSTRESCKIVMAAHEEEIKDENTDKSKRFFETCTTLFTQHHSKEITIMTPFESITKTQLLAVWLRSWNSKYSVSPYITTTCYYGNNCGRCKSCYKRAIALVSAGWNEDPDMKEDIFADAQDWIYSDFLQRFETFPLKRRLEYLIAFERRLPNLKGATKTLVQPLLNKYRDQIDSYAISLNKISSL